MTEKELVERYGDRAQFNHVQIWRDFQNKLANDAAAEWGASPWRPEGAMALPHSGRWRHLAPMGQPLHDRRRSCRRADVGARGTTGRLTPRAQPYSRWADVAQSNRRR